MQRYAYTDESGNSGLKLFDSGQDTFWTGTLVSFADMDTRYRTFHQELLTTVNKPELHGAELGFGGIEKIASRIAWFIREKKLLFIFGRVDKHYLAATKLFDLAFDSGANPAMPPQAYAIQQLRLLCVMHFIQLLGEEDLREFWDIFQKQDSQRFGSLLDRILPRVAAAGFDHRTEQILTDVLKWGSLNPAEVLDPFDEGDSPNFVAFCGLFGHLHTLYEETGDTIGSFVHDEQNQFISIFRTGFDILSRFTGRNHPMAMMSDWREVPSFDCSLQQRSSSGSFGLQLVDVCLWLIKRVIDKRDKPHGNCAVLLDCLIERSLLSRFDFHDLLRMVKEGTDFVENLPLTDEKLMRGQEILNTIESNRQRRLAPPASQPDDGG